MYVYKAACSTRAKFQLFFNIYFNETHIVFYKNQDLNEKNIYLEEFLFKD